MGYNKKLKILTWITFAIPIAVAGMLTMFDNPVILAITKIASGVLGFIAALIGLLALVGKWSDMMADSQRAMIENSRLHDSWKDARNLTDAAFVSEYKKLLILDSAQSSSDKLLEVSDKDKRRMMRKTLVQYQMACKTCKNTPTSIKAGKAKCDTCGNF